MDSNSYMIEKEIMESKTRLIIGAEQIRNQLKFIRDFVFNEETNDEYTKFLDIRGIVLLYGKPGTGKTSICYECMLGYPDASYYNLNMSTLISEKLGKTAKLVNAFFEKIIEETKKYKVFLLIEEIEAFLPNRSNSKELEDMKRALTVFMHYLDLRIPNLMILCTTNYKDLLDTAILRRFIFTYKISNDDKQDFEKFLVSEGNPFHNKFENESLDELTNSLIEKGMTFSDLKLLMRSLCFGQQGLDFNNISVQNLKNAVEKWEENNE